MQNDLQGVRDFYDGFESPLQDKSQETRDKEAHEKVVYDLHVEAMDALKAEHIRHASQIEADFVEVLAESDETLPPSPWSKRLTMCPPRTSYR